MSDERLAVDLAADRSEIDASLAELCDNLPPLSAPVPDVIRYALRGQGKRFRGMLVTGAFRAAGGDGSCFELAAAVEVVHAYSLVHDDLPCMDDDDVRRGRPTTHRVYGVGPTVVGGVTMLPIAARAVVRSPMPLSASKRAAILAELMRGAGASGMIGGQLRDLEAESTVTATTAELELIHRAKTGALMAAAARVGGIAAGASGAAMTALGEYGADVGLAFQIVDDVLDVTASTTTLGKTAGRDSELGKSTYPALLGVEGAMARASGLVREGCAALESEGLLTPQLRHLADIVITRTH